MAILQYSISIFWIIFIGYWIVSAIGVKKNIHNNEWRRDAGIRILFIIIIIVLLQVNSLRHFFEYQSGLVAQTIGVVLCGAGIAFAIWARWCLGRNWSGTPSMKEGHELVTTGPYRFVRHPIYTGMLVALFGSALTIGMVFLAIFVIFCANFIYRIPIEEKYMMRLFPEKYQEYKKKTKALIPFIA